MLKAMTFPAERADEVVDAARRLVELSTEQLEICRVALDDLEFTGELQKDFVKRLVGIQSEIRRQRSALKALATSPGKAPSS